MNYELGKIIHVPLSDVNITEVRAPLDGLDKLFVAGVRSNKKTFFSRFGIPPRTVVTLNESVRSISADGLKDIQSSYIIGTPVRIRTHDQDAALRKGAKKLGLT